MNFSNRNRNDWKLKLKQERYDVLIIGGGITGAGIALDTATRGMKTALVEMQDFAAGTSSRSTKLVHGGLRYLKQFEVKMVAEVGKERAVVYENGPHVTTPEWMLLPLHKGGSFGKFSTGIGLRVYDFLAGVKRSEFRKMLSRESVLEKEPLIKKEGLLGGGYYVEYRTDDARLTMEVMKKAVESGALAMNYTKVESIVSENGKAVGVEVRDLLTDETYTIYAKKIINAAGPWVDEVRKLEKSTDGISNGKSLRHTKGVHIVIDQSKFPLKQAIYFDTPDGRMIFAIPREGKAYIGTTDTFYDKNLAEPRMTEEDRDYLINSVHYMFPDVKISVADIESSWAGVRPLIHEEGKDPSEISRKDEIWESESGLITIAGGKLTGYRKMAEMVTDLLVKNLKKEDGSDFGSCVTKHLPISGGDVGGSEGFQAFRTKEARNGKAIGLSEDEASRLSLMYGSNASKLFSLANKHTNHGDLPLSLFLQLQYSIEEEMAATPVDFFFRRTGLLLFDIEKVHQHKEAVITYMANVFGWNETEIEKWTQDLETEIKAATIG